MRKWRNIHLKVEIGKDGRVFYCDSHYKAAQWLNAMLGTNFVCGDDIRYYNETHNIDQIYMSYIWMPIAEFYERRKTYVKAVNMAERFMCRAQRTTSRRKRTARLNIFCRYYDLANAIWHHHPAVWHGEV